MGGEKYLPCFNADGFVGSPPHRRGKGGSRRIVCAQIGITPAWAGKRAGTPARWSQCRDHPRVGGEKALHEHTEFPRVGSPPRGRGKGAGIDFHDLGAGITPAWAGKSSAPFSSLPQT